MIGQFVYVGVSGNRVPSGRRLYAYKLHETNRRARRRPNFS